MKWNNWLFMYYICHIESYDHTNWCWAELECEATVEEFGTASLSRIVLSLNLKSVFEKRMLQTYCLDSFLACSALQGMPSLSAQNWELCKNGNSKYTNETVIPVISVLCYNVTCRWTPLVKNCSLCAVLVTDTLVKYWFILNPTLDI